MRGDEFLFWGGLAALGVAYEWRALRSKDAEHTLSDVTRDVFRTDTHVGRIIWTVAWGCFSTWFSHHILNNPEPGL